MYLYVNLFLIIFVYDKYIVSELLTLVLSITGITTIGLHLLISHVNPGKVRKMSSGTAFVNQMQSHGLLDTDDLQQDFLNLLSQLQSSKD